MKTKRADRSAVRDVTIAFTTTKEIKKHIQDMADRYGLSISMLMRIITEEFLSRRREND